VHNFQSSRFKSREKWHCAIERVVPTFRSNVIHPSSEPSTPVSALRERTFSLTTADSQRQDRILFSLSRKAGHSVELAAYIRLRLRLCFSYRVGLNEAKQYVQLCWWRYLPQAVMISTRIVRNCNVAQLEAFGHPLPPLWDTYLLQLQPNWIVAADCRRLRCLATVDTCTAS